MSPERTVDALSDRYVEEAAALDPMMAAYAGIAGHDDRLPDLSPTGFAERAELDKQVLAAVRAATPVDERERVAQEAFLERLGLKVEMYDAGIVTSQVSVTAGPMQNVRGVLDLMPTDGEEAQRNISARLAAVPQALAEYRETLLESADRGRVSARRQLGEVAKQVRRWTGQDGGTDLFHKLVDGLRRRGQPRRRPGPQRGRGERGVRRVRPVLRRRAGTARPGARGGRPRRVRPVQPLVPRRHRRPRRDLRLGLGGAQTARRREARDGRPHQVRQHRPRGGRRPGRRSGPDRGGTRAVPGVDAGAVRPDRRRDGRRPLRHPRADPAARVLPGADQRRRDLLHGPSEDFSRPGRMWWSVPDGIERVRHLAGDDDGLPRGRAGPSPPGCADDVPRRPAQPLAAQRLLGQRSRRGLGAVRRAADGRPRLPGRPRRLHGHARRPVHAGRPGDRGHRHAPRAGDPEGQPVRLPPGRDLDTRARAWRSCATTA